MRICPPNRRSQHRKSPYTRDPRRNVAAATSLWCRTAATSGGNTRRNSGVSSARWAWQRPAELLPWTVQVPRHRQGPLASSVTLSTQPSRRATGRTVTPCSVLYTSRLQPLGTKRGPASPRPHSVLHGLSLIGRADPSSSRSHRGPFSAPTKQT